MVKTHHSPSCSPITADDLFLFNEGTHFRLYEKLGARAAKQDGRDGVYFAVWAPNAARVSVIGSFNGWQPGRAPLTKRADSGVFEGFIEGVKNGDAYKYRIDSLHNGYQVDKTDPYGYFQEVPPRTASRVWDLSYQWSDQDWLARRRERQALEAPMSVYEVHLGSWMRHENRAHLSYRELATRLVEYVVDMGFTHVQLMPITEHPFYGSWGYGTTGYFAPTSRYGNPQELMLLIDTLHQAGVGVFLDWVPAHFPSDAAALGYFDGTWLYEHADPRKGKHPDWKTLIYNYGRHEVRSFLISSAMFWIDRYHVDGLRVDAVASMLYLDYSRGEGEWVANDHGGKENLEAIDFLRKMNEAVYGRFPDVQMIAEESTSWPMVSRPVWLGGLGFGLKWDMGWMHDTLAYFSSDPVFRRFNHNQITFRQFYADAENFMLPLSHDEVVYGKGSLLRKMPGDTWQKFANLRLLFAWMFGQNGKKLLFMGDEFGQWDEWNHESSLDWPLLERASHAGVQRLVRALNRLYRDQPAMHQKDIGKQGFEWIDCGDAEQSVVAFVRKGDAERDVVLALLNFTPVPRDHYRFGVPFAGRWRVLLNSDDPEFGGSGYLNQREFTTTAEEWHGRPQSISVSLPPLAAVFLRGEPASPPDEGV